MRWIAVAAIAVMIAWCRHDDGAEKHPQDLQRLIARLPTPAQLKLRPAFVLTGDLRFEGQTVDSKKQPIVGAIVKLNGNMTTTSEADGSFAFDHLAPGDYVVSAETATLYGENTMTLEADSEPLILEMIAGPTLRVHVADRGGQGVRDAKLEVRYRTAVTDRDGNGVLRGIDRESVRLDVSADNFGPVNIQIDVGDDPRATIESNVVLEPGTPFGGTVVDEQGAPVANASIDYRQDHVTGAVEADEHGRWVVPFLGPGKVALTAYSEAHLSAPDQVVDHDGPRLDVVVHVVLGAVARGIVVDAGGKPVGGASIIVGRSRGISNEAGRFEIKGIIPGHLEVSATSDHMGSVIQTIELDHSVELQIEMVESSITGIVRDSHGEPVESAELIARGQSYGFARTDDRGRFDFGGLTPGAYEVFAHRAADKLGMPRIGLSVHSGTRNLAIVLPELGTISGHIVAAGKPVDYFGVSVMKSPQKQFESRFLMVTVPVHSTDGAFTLTDLTPGTYSFVVEGPSFKQTVIDDVVVREAATTELGSVSVDRGRVIRGTVRDERGIPIAGARVAVGGDAYHLDDEPFVRKINGVHEATSDAAGDYEISGLEEDVSLGIQAVRGDAMAAPRMITPDEAVVDLVIARTGSIEGLVVNERGIATNVRIDAKEGEIERSINTGIGGDFHLDRMPAGNYVVRLMYDHAMLPLEIHVDANATTQVRIELPPEPITLAVTKPGCERVSIQVPGNGETLQLQNCTNGAAGFVDVVPGTYKVCWDGFEQCTPVTVSPTPNRQTLALLSFPDAAE